MSEAVVPRGTLTPNFNLNLPDIAGDWDIWGALTNDNWTFLDGALLPIWGGVMTGLLTLFGDPVAPLGAATKRYVDAVAANQNNYLPLAGGTMTGALQVPQGSAAAAAVQLGQPNTGLYAPAGGNVGLTAAGTGIFLSSSITARFLIPLQVAADPTAALGVATKQYVDAVSAQFGNYLALSGGQMTGPLITMAGTGGSSLGIGIGNNTTGLWSSAGNALVVQTGGGTNLHLTPTGNIIAVATTMAAGATLTLAADATQPMQAATLQQVTAITGGPYLLLTGGQLTGSLGMGQAIPTAPAPFAPSLIAAGAVVGKELNINAYHSTAATWNYVAAGAASHIVVTGANTIQLSVAAAGAAGAAVAFNTATTFDSLGNVILSGAPAIPSDAQGAFISAPYITIPEGQAYAFNTYIGSGPAWKMLQAGYGAYQYIDASDGHWAITLFGNAATGANAIPAANLLFDQAGNLIVPGAVFAGAAPANYFLSASASFRVINFSPDGWQLQWRTSDGAFIYAQPGGGSPWYCQGENGATVQTGNCYAAAYPGPSDARLKDDVEPWATGLAALLQLNPISWRWTGEPIPDDGRPHVGFSAQDVQPIIPEAVHEMTPLNEGDAVYLALEQAPLNAAVINALKEIDARLRALEAPP